MLLRELLSSGCTRMLGVAIRVGVVIVTIPLASARGITSCATTKPLAEAGDSSSSSYQQGLSVQRLKEYHMLLEKLV